jgi:hypothetical protein
VTDEQGAAKTETKTAKKRRKAGGRPFKAGEPSANPNGRPKGTRNKVTVVAEALIQGQAQTIIQKIVSLALEGDTALLKWLGDRLVPVVKEKPVRFDLPPITDAQSALLASRLIVAGCAAGELTTEQGQELGRVLEQHARLLEVADLEGRLAALEAERGVGPGAGVPH